MRLSDYVMECDINTSTCGDIEVAKHYAEMCVAAAIVESLAKCMTICEHASEPSAFSIIMESAGATNSDGTVDEKAVETKTGEAKQKWYTKIIEWIKSAIGNIMTALDRNNPVNTKKMLVKLKDSGKVDSTLNLSGIYVKYLVETTELFEKLTNVLSSNTGDKKQELMSIKEAADEITAKSESLKSNNNSFSSESDENNLDELIEYYNLLIETDIPKTCKNMKSKLEKIKTGGVVYDYDTQLTNATASSVMKAYSIAYKHFNKNTVDVARAYNKKAKKPGKGWSFR